MDSSAYHLLLIPICEGVGVGLLAGTLIRLALGWLTARIDRGLPVKQGSPSAQPWRQPKSSPGTMGDSKVTWKQAI